MQDFFNFDNAFFRALSRVADLIILNIAFIICSIPIFTIGASMTAMYYVTLKMAENEEGYVLRTFWRSFRQNFKQATLIWLGMLAAGCVLVLDVLILNGTGSSFAKIFLILIFATIILYCMVLLYVFPLLSRFENKMLTTVRNAFIISLADFPRTLAMLIIIVAAVLLTFLNAYTFWYGLLVWILCGFSAIAYLNSWLFFRKIFKKYTPQEEEEEVTEE